MALAAFACATGALSAKAEVRGQAPQHVDGELHAGLASFRVDEVLAATAGCERTACIEARIAALQIRLQYAEAARLGLALRSESRGRDEAVENSAFLQAQLSIGDAQITSTAPLEWPSAHAMHAPPGRGEAVGGAQLLADGPQALISIAGSPVWAVIDTASATAVPAGAVDRYGWDGSAGLARFMVDGAGRQVPAAIGVLPDVTVGGMRADRALAFALSSIDRPVLGLDLLLQTPGLRVEPGPGAVEFTLREDGLIACHPMRLEQTAGVMLHLVATVPIDGEQVDVIIDTGDSAPATIFERSLLARMKGQGAQVRGLVETLGHAGAGTATAFAYPRAILGVALEDPIVYQPRDHIAPMRIGMGILRHVPFLLDFEGRRFCVGARPG